MSEKLYNQNDTLIEDNKHTVYNNSLTVNAYRDNRVLPTAEELQKLKDVDPKLIDFYMDMAKDNQDQAKQRDNSIREDLYQIAKMEYKQSRTSMLLKGSIIFSCVVISGVLIALDKDVAGTLFGLSGLGGLMSTLYGEYKNKNNQENNSNSQ